MTKKTDSAQITLSVVVDRVRSTSEGFSVYDAITGARSWERQTVKQFTGPVRAGQRWCVAGAEVEDPRWGTQFVAQFATLGVPESVHELSTMLTSGLVDGWDWQGTAALYRAYPEQKALAVCLSSPALLAEVPGITPAMVDSLRGAMQRASGMASLYAQLAEWGLKGRMAEKLVQYYGFTVVDKLTGNPYADVLAIPGYGWKTAETIAQALGIAYDDPRRIVAALEVAVHEGTWADGHTWMHGVAATVAGMKLSHLSYTDVEAQLQAAIDAGNLIEEEDRIVPANLQRAEVGIAGQVAQRLTQAPLLARDMVDSLEQPEGISDAQWTAVQMALSTPLSLLTGGPGVGKTTALRALVRMAQQAGLAVTCMAPTGKAAARMTEATGLQATTIHSRLRIIPGSTTNDEDFEAVTGMVVVDEVSMLDTSLAAALLSRISTRAHILLVGDPDQLPSVGPGAVLRDLITADVLPRVHLTHVYRNDAGVAINAARMRDGDVLLDLPDCALLRQDTPEQACRAVVDLVCAATVGGGTVNDVLVLTPTNQGPTGRYALNALLQPLLNTTPAGTGIVQYAGSTTDPTGAVEKHSEELRRGDRVMVTRNHAELRVFNGQIGTVVDVVVPRSLTVAIDGRPVVFAGEDKRIVTLAYAITGHKSQGSEAPHVIAPIFPSRVLSREWLYTVITRARESVTLVGDISAIQGAIAVQHASLRRTGLVDRIAGCLDACGPTRDVGELHWAWNGSSEVYHTRRAACGWLTSCGVDARGDEWGFSPLEDARPCLRCSASTGAVLRPFPVADPRLAPALEA